MSIFSGYKMLEVSGYLKLVVVGGQVLGVFRLERAASSRNVSDLQMINVPRSVHDWRSQIAN